MNKQARINRTETLRKQLYREQKTKDTELARHILVVLDTLDRAFTEEGRRANIEFADKDCNEWVAYLMRTVGMYFSVKYQLRCLLLAETNRQYLGELTVLWDFILDAIEQDHELKCVKNRER